jgi:hypothetical protein
MTACCSCNSLVAKALLDCVEDIICHRQSSARSSAAWSRSVAAS